MKSQSNTKSRAKTTCNQEVFAEVAKELGLPIQTVKDIFSCHSAYTKQVMESNSFDGVAWPYFGCFRSKPKEVQVLNHLRGLTPEQQKEFKQQVRQGKYKLMVEKKQKDADAKRHSREGSQARERGEDLILPASA
jgi:hypothetical protein